MCDKYNWEANTVEDPDFGIWPEPYTYATPIDAAIGYSQECGVLTRENQVNECQNARMQANGCLDMHGKWSEHSDRVPNDFEGVMKTIYPAGDMNCEGEPTEVQWLPLGQCEHGKNATCDPYGSYTRISSCGSTMMDYYDGAGHCHYSMDGSDTYFRLQSSCATRNLKYCIPYFRAIDNLSCQTEPAGDDMPPRDVHDERLRRYLDQFVHRDDHDGPDLSECEGNLMEHGVFRIGDKLVAHHCPSHSDGTPRYCPQLDPGLYHIGDITEHHRYRYLPMECGSNPHAH